MRLLTLRAVALTLVFISLMGPAGPNPIAAQEATSTATPTPFTGETFVGRTSDPDTFVAVVVAEPAGNSEERQARAYLCNATMIDAWLVGTLAGDRLDLSAEDGAQLEATLGEVGMEGTATLANRTSLTFTAQRATGIAGLYTVTIEANGQLHGVSAAGGELTGRVEAGGGTTTPAPRSRLVMTVITPESASVELQAAAVPTITPAAGTTRLIVLEDGQLRGKRTKDSKGDEGFIDPTNDL